MTGATPSIHSSRRAQDDRRGGAFRPFRRGDDDSLRSTEAAISPLPDDVEALKALLVSAFQKADEAEVKLASADARKGAIEALIAHLKLQIAKLKREQYGASAERGRRLLDQMAI